MSLVMLLFWGLLAGVAVWAVRSSGHTQPVVDLTKSRVGEGRGAEAVLAERFARGEIDEAEFTRRRGVLRGESGS